LFSSLTGSHIGDIMVRVALAAALFAAATTVQAAQVPSILPGAYIIEYEDNHVSRFLKGPKARAGCRH
jgi:hypothetical protein